MKAAIFAGAGQPLRIVDMPDPEPAADEVVIRVARCGICGTDVHATDGHGWTWPVGAQLGHEYAGEIVEIGHDVAGLCKGDRVAVRPFVGCGACRYCDAGRPNFCARRRDYAAGFAEYARINARGALRLPQSLSLDDAALIEPLAVSLHALNLAAPSPGDRILICGPGPTGLGLLHWTHQRGIRNVAILSRSHRREPIARAMGVTHFLTEGADVTDRIAAALGGPPDIVFEAVGLPGAINRAIELVAPLGRVVSLGFCLSPDTLVPVRAHRKEVSVHFSYGWTLAEFAESADALALAAAAPLAMVTDTIPLGRLPATLEELRGGHGGCKVLVDPWR